MALSHVAGTGSAMWEGRREGGGWEMPALSLSHSLVASLPALHTRTHSLHVLPSMSCACDVLNGDNVVSRESLLTF